MSWQVLLWASTAKPWDSRGCTSNGFERGERQYGPLSLQNLEVLDRWPEAELSQEVLAFDELQEVARRRRE
jgi:hypothetical protein